MARVTRAAMVASGTRNAAAISAVVSPQSSRSVSATCASRASAGWQQVKTSRSRSSVITSSVLAVHGAASGPSVHPGLDQQRQLAAQGLLAAQHVERPAPGGRS